MGLDSKPTINLKVGQRQNSNIAVRAEEARQRLALPLPQYLATYEVLRSLHPLDFGTYVEFTERWAPPVLQTILAAYPDVALLRACIGAEQATMIERAARVGITLHALSRFGAALLQYLKTHHEPEWLDATQAFERWNGNAAEADASLALPLIFRDHPAVGALMKRGGVSMLRDQSLFELAVTVTDGGCTVDVDLLRKFQDAGAWPNPRRMVRVYGLALQFRAIGVLSDAALRRAADAYDRLSPRKYRRAIRDRGYFRYAVLGERPQPNIAPEARNFSMSGGSVRVRRVSALVSTVASAAETPAPIVDLRTVHRKLRLDDLVPDRVDAETAAALIVYGLCDLGKGLPFAGRCAIPERHVLANIRRRFAPESGALNRAWTWLRSVGVAAHPSGRRSGSVYTLDLRSDHDRPEAREIVRRTLSFLAWFREQTRH